MMPDLGSYGDAVWGAYAVTFVLLVGIVVISRWRSERVKSELESLERKHKRDG